MRGLALFLLFGGMASAVASSVASSVADVPVPPLTGAVMDLGNMFSSATVSSLESYLRGLKERGGAQIEVVTVPDLGGQSIEEVSIRMTDQWKLGKKKEDRGLLLLFAAQEHRVRIEVGQGLEGDVTDVTANRIINEVIVPRMKEGAPDRAVMDGVLSIVHSTDPTLVEDAGQRMPTRSHVAKGGGLRRIFTILFWLFILLIFLRPRGGGGGMGGLLAYGLLGGLGRGGGGDSGGGGWSGGGGGFSGGGSSGSW